VHQSETGTDLGRAGVVLGHGPESRTGPGCDHGAVDQTLTERYAAAPAWRRPVTIAAVVVLAAAALAWLAWAAFVESTPKVNSQLISWQVVDAHSATARVDVSIAGGTTHPVCTVQALASDHTIVGQLRFTPADGTNVVSVQTSRTATSVDVPGCIADGQDQPR
jgi:hypothetical protein